VCQCGAFLYTDDTTVHHTKCQKCGKNFYITEGGQQLEVGSRAYNSILYLPVTWLERHLLSSINHYKKEITMNKNRTPKGTKPPFPFIRAQISTRGFDNGYIDVYLLRSEPDEKGNKVKHSQRKSFGSFTSLCQWKDKEVATTLAWLKSNGLTEEDITVNENWGCTLLEEKEV